MEPQFRLSSAANLAVNFQRVDDGIVLHIIRYDYNFEKGRVLDLEALDLELSLPGKFGRAEVFAPNGSPNAEFETISDGLYHLRLTNIPLYTVVLLKNQTV